MQNSDTKPVKPRKPKKNKSTLDSQTLAQLILASLDDDQAEDILNIDLAGKSSVADIMIVASGRSNRHVSAIADHIISKLKENGFGKVKVEGMQNADWVLIDAGDVITHLFRPEVRQFYAIEKIWSGEIAHSGGA